ncbi:hypothetical protein GCM10028784_11770 [Myceligenerans cantabricum]
MRVYEWGTARGRRTVLVAVLVVVLVAVGALVVRAVWPEPPPPIVSESKVHPPAPVGPDGGAQTCDADDLDVRLVADRSTVTDGEAVVFTVTLENSGPAPCLVDGADENRPVTVWAGDSGQDADRVWSSGDCADGERMLLLGPGSVDTHDVRWTDERSVPGCGPVKGKAGPGTYSVQVTVDDVDGAASQVVLVDKQEPPKPSPSPSSSSSSSDKASRSPGPSGSPSPEPSGSPTPTPSEPRQPDKDG